VEAFIRGDAEVATKPARAEATEEIAPQLSTVPQKNT
jgi:hypothetical protein